MPSIERDESRESRDSRERDRDSLVLRHQHSFSESGRASVPMWDSSDPERAPPPLPLNPGTSSSPVTRPNTSARIEEAAALITAKARENVPSAYTSNAMSSGSPEKSLVKPHHRRIQSVQNGNVRGISDSLERRSPEKGLRAPRIAEYESRSAERSPTRSGSETPTPGGRATPPYLNKSASQGENAPPSATMLTLHSMRARAESEAPLSNITNSSSNAGRAPYTFDAISSQILSLTSIATNLQREMAALSRRSKDNAMDLISLKEATNARDEDIRNSLKDLVINLDTRLLPASEAPRSTPIPGLYIDNKAHNSTPSRKNISLPRIPSPNSFSPLAMERELTASPSIVSSDGAASIALLEKVLREMGTKDGQDKILKTLEKVRSCSRDVNIDPSLLTKLEEVLKLLRDDSASRALVRSHQNSEDGGPLRLDFVSGQMTRATKDNPTENRKAADHSHASELVNDEMMKILNRVKQSVSEGGGLTNEVKALVRELRGEVLGMGREIAKKLEQAESTHKSLRADIQGPGREQVAQIVEEGLHELKQHMDQVVRENRRQSAASTKSLVDIQEVVLPLRKALAEIPQPQQARDRAVDREEMLSAVREAWEDCKPEIALEHFGLERDEILETLKEGLRSYQPRHPEIREVGASYDEVLDAVRKGLADFQPPPLHTQASITREEILMSVRECLESFEFPVPIPPAAPTKEYDLTREDVFEAVKEGLNSQSHITKEIEFNRDDLFNAVKAGLEGGPTPTNGVGEQVLDQMHEFLVSMKTEFKQYSAANGKDTEQVLDALKDSFEVLRAANGKDTEQVLDLVKDSVEVLRAANGNGKDAEQVLDVLRDGLEVLRAENGKDTDQVLEVMKVSFEGFRAEIESYVDRAADVTGKDEIIETVKDGFRLMQADIEKVSNNRGTTNTPELLDVMEKEFEHLRESMTKSLARATASTDHNEILDAIHDLSDERGSSLSSNSEDVVRLVKEELEHLRSTIAGTLVRAASSVDREEILETIREGLEANRNPRKVDGNESILSNTSELLDAFQEGVDGIRADMERLMNRPVDISTSYEILDTLKAGLDSVRSDIERLHASQRDLSDTATAKGREVMIHDENLISTEIEGLKVMITQLRIKVEAMDGVPPVAEPSNQDDLNEIHRAVRDVHAAIHQLGDSRNASTHDNGATKDDTDAIETLLRNVKAKLDDFRLPDSEGLAKSLHLESVEDLVRETKAIVEQSDAHARAEHASKEDFSIMESLLRDVVIGVEELQGKVKTLTSDDDRITKTDIQVIETLCLDTKTQLDEFTGVDFASIPTKDDFKTVHHTIKTFQEQIEAENELTAQAFEARKIEHGGLANKIDDVKGILGEIRGELMEKLDGSEEGIMELSKVLGHHHESMATYASAASIEELVHLVKQEFEKQHEQHSKVNAEAEERDSALMFKHEETQATISSELSVKIEEKFAELMTKYDDAQSSNAGKLDTLEARDGKHLEALTSTKAVVDDLKLLIDTLGSTTTDACDRISDDSKTVFNRVAEANTKLDELHQVSASQHGLTREEVAKAVAAAMRLEGSIMEHQPAMLEAIKEVMAIVGQHYEQSQAHYQYSQSTTDEIRSNINAIPSAIPPLLPALPAPPPPLTMEVPVSKEYDDSQVHDKLNLLLNHASGAKEALSKVEKHASSTKESLANIEKLDEIHEQMLRTAGEVSTMISTQTRLMAEHHDSRAAAAAEAGVALEKRVAQKEKVEAEILALTVEKNELLSSVDTLKKEKEQLSGQSKQLTREVAKLETALTIRQEEMREMDLRAERLERKILEGVMDHARSLNMLRPTAGGKRSKAAERDRAMSLKRVPSSASTATAKTTSTKEPSDGTGSRLGGAVSMALKKRTPLSSAANSVVSSRSSGVERRILSTSHVTGHRAREPAAAERQLMLAPTASPAHSGLVSLKRSHSVKSTPSSYHGGGRKTSWNGPARTDISTGSVDKENEVLTEEDEDEGEGNEGSEAGTERRTSFSGTSGVYTDTDSLAYGTGSSLGRNSSCASAVRSVSYASSAAGVIGGKEESILEEDERGEVEGDEDGAQDEDERGGEGEDGAGQKRLTMGPGAAEEDEEGEGGEEDARSQDDESAQIMALLGPPPASSSVCPTDDDNDNDSDSDLDDSSSIIDPSQRPTTSATEEEKALAITLSTTAHLNSAPAHDHHNPDHKTDPKLGNLAIYHPPTPHSDSGLGSEPHTANTERGMRHAPGYFGPDLGF